MGNATPHTPGPWYIDPEDPCTICDDPNAGRVIADVGFYNPDDPDEDPTERIANARRIVAAVNVCEGISTEELERQRTVGDGVPRIAELVAAAEESAALLDDIGSDDLPDTRSLVDVVRIGYRLHAAITAMKEML